MLLFIWIRGHPGAAENFTPGALELAPGTPGSIFASFLSDFWSVFTQILKAEPLKSMQIVEEILQKSKKTHVPNKW